MRPLSTVWSALHCLYEAGPAVVAAVATVLGEGDNTTDCPAEELLPKGLAFFKHEEDGVIYHGIHCSRGSAETSPGLEPAPGVVVHCTHGFGASSLSFANLIHAAQGQREKAQAQRPVGSATWVAHDVLGFGFTRADLKLCPHSPHPPAVLERLFLSGNSRPTLGICEALGGEAKRAVFLGHSMGSVSAITSAYHWLMAGKTVDAVVLLAPAISLRTLEGGNANNFLPAATPLLQSVTTLTKLWPLMPRPVRRSLLATVLKLGVSLDLFWYIGLRFALGWHQEVDAGTLEQYKSPMARPNWAPWLVAFIEANLLPSEAGCLKAASACLAFTLKEMLTALLDAGVKVLIIHDPSDTFIPIENSEELLAAFQGRVQLAVVRQYCGHILHEVVPECVLDAMARHGVPV
eukprot:EG_transcript_6426